MADYPNAHVIETEGWPVTFTDGIHPNGAGARVMGERVAEGIRALGLI
jgi:lysophospholipase L1-like esterase